MPRRKVCACGCGEPVVKPRKRYSSDECVKRGASSTVRARRLEDPPIIPPRPQRPLGDVLGNRVWWPGHPLAQKTGWVAAARFAAFNERRGVCVCDATGQPMEWEDVKVFMVDDKSMMLCPLHGFLRLLAKRIVDTGFGGSKGVAVAEAMGALWSEPCPPREESSATRAKE